MIENMSVIMNKLFDKMGFDIASLLSVVLALFIFVYQKKNSEKKEEMQEFNKTMERMRLSFESIKNNFLDKSILISDLTEEYKYKRIGLDELKKEATKASGEITLKSHIIKEEIQFGCKSALLIINDKNKRLALEKAINDSLKKLDVSVRFGCYLMNNMIKLLWSMDQNKIDHENITEIVAGIFRFPRGSMIVEIKDVESMLSIIKDENDFNKLEEETNEGVRLCSDVIEIYKNKDNQICDDIDFGFAPVINRFFEEVTDYLYKIDN